MALIKCPECGREISNKASACIHCGYPLTEEDKNIEIEDVGKKNEIVPDKKMQYTDTIYGIVTAFETPISISEVRDKLNECNIGITDDEIQECLIELVNKKKIKRIFDGLPKYIAYKEDEEIGQAVTALKRSYIVKSNLHIPKCPTCGSAMVVKISAGEKIFGASLFGLMSSDVRNIMHCKNCGYKW